MHKPVPFPASAAIAETSTAVVFKDQGWSFPSLFERQVERTPDAMAIAFEDVSLGYAELNARANRLAHFLIRQGIGPEHIVALALPRSLDLVVVLIGILKAGAAYLPLDANYPAERLAFMLDDAAPIRLLTVAEIAPRLPGGRPTIQLDDPVLAAALARLPDSNPTDAERLSPLTPDNQAYVIYTSGSTGRPKGVVVTHAGIANLAANQIDRFAINAESRILQFASVSFDAAVSELCIALLSGARLILAPAARLMPGDSLAALIAQSGATHATLPPSALAVLAADALPKDFTLIVAGEACPPHLVEQWSANRRMINAYGPTEATVCATMTEALSGAIAPPLGHPIRNCGIYILDPLFQKVSVGVPGELYIAGIGLARGYLGRPDLTAERFLPDPFGKPGSRMYRSGDLACWRADGAIDFLGRVDHQVKIRGFRVEPGEIEAVLARHAAIEQVAVIAREDHQGQQQLVGYIVPVAGQIADTAALRQYAAERLPDYMVPAALVSLDVLPLTPNGKLDRKALPAPEFASDGAAANALASTPNEALVAALFREVLGIERFGMQDSFFDLGGHSLGATRLLSRIRAVSGINLELDDVFDAPTVAGLAARLEAASPESAMPAIPTSARGVRLPLSFSQQRLWFLDQLEPGNPFYNMPGAVRLEGPLDMPALKGALNEIVRRHAALRTTFRVIGDTPIQIIDDTLMIDLPLTDLRGFPAARRSEEERRLTQIEKQTGFDLASGPLIRTRLLRVDDEQHTLLITVQHTVADGWSMVLLVNEMAALYAAYARGLPSPLPELAIQYADYSQWQRSWLCGEVLERQLQYWKQQLAGSPELLELPTDRPRPAVKSFRGSEHVSCFLPSTLTAPLQALAIDHDATMFMAMLTVLDIVLMRWTGQTDLVVGTVMAGRTNDAVEPLIGCFINFLPLRVQCSPLDSARDLLQRLTTTVREAYAHQDAPFEKITEAINPRRDPSHNPIFNVGFLLQNFPECTSYGDTLSAEMLPVTQDTGALDLRFVAQETSNGVHLSCEYSTELFDQATLVELLDTYRSMLAQCVGQPDAPIGELPFSAIAVRRAANDRVQHMPSDSAVDAVSPLQNLVIAASFTAEPLQNVLTFWMERFGIAATVGFAPYNQILQTLLDPQSVFAANRQGVNVVLLRLEDWIRFQQEGASPEDHLANLRQNCADFLAAIGASRRHAALPLLVGLCPPSKAFRARAGYGRWVEDLQRHLMGELRGIAGVYPFGEQELQRFYPVENFEDVHGDKLGHIPYSSDMYAALATLLARKTMALLARPYKVIVLDCDNTLWHGVCGERGPDGVEITPAHRALQRFMVEQSEAGVLLCLASKNNAADVGAVFASHEDMPLQPEHFIASRVNWQPKSQSIRELAAELNLGADSFIFIDDNPVECAEVEGNCPGTLVLQLPEDIGHIPKFLDHVWAFDRIVVTADAQQRTRLYRDNKEREAVRASASSFAEFLDSLQLRVTIGSPRSAQLERAAELTQRTNQFNLRPQPRQAGELQALGDRCLVVEVADRFGDYGLTGVVVYEAAQAVLRIDTLLLSCRILGRGVEYRVMAHLAVVAEEMGCSTIALPYLDTGKNQPLLNFLKAIGGSAMGNADTSQCFTMAASVASDLQPVYAADDGAPGRVAETALAREPSVAAAQIRHIAQSLTTTQQILECLSEARRRLAASEHEYIPPETTTEQELASIWAKVLNRDRVGIRSNFFTLGGHSLLAAQVISQVRTMFRIDLPMRALFEAPTVDGLAILIEDAQLEELDRFDETELQEMLTHLSITDDLGADDLGTNKQT